MSTPVLVYDDDCGFCTWCAEWVIRRSSLEAVGFANLTPDQRSRLPAEFTECAHLLTDTGVYSCGVAMEKALLRVYPWLQRPVGLLRRLPGYARLRSRAYQWVADHRAWFGSIRSAVPPVEKRKPP